MNNRVVFSDDGVLEDFSAALNNYQSGSCPFQLVAADDYIYIGSKLPFNHIYIKPLVVNTEDSDMTVEIWDGTTWNEVVELTDGTNGFKNSGHVEFTPNKDKFWQMESTSYNGETVTGLEDIVIYDRYWVRMSFSNDLANVTPGVNPDPDVTIDMSLAWVGNIFSNDADLKGEYPEIVKAKYLTAFEAGKTSWEEQHVSAANLIIQDLIDFGVIKEKGQILDWRQLTSAAIHKVAEIIYNSFGDDYTDQSIAARKEYNARINKRHYLIDTNNNAVAEPVEETEDQGFFSR